MKICLEAEDTACAPVDAGFANALERWGPVVEFRPVVSTASSDADIRAPSRFARELAHNGGAGQVIAPVLTVPSPPRPHHGEQPDLLTEIEQLLSTGQPKLAVERFISALLTAGLSATSTAPIAVAQPSSNTTVLTRREREVTRLIAAGYTNRCIADELYIAQSTVERHVANILNKLGFNSRTQIAAWAVASGLAAAGGLAAI